MTAKRQASESHGHPMQLLVAGSEEQCAVLRKVLCARDDNAVHIEQAGSLEEATAKLSRRIYDLVVFAECEWDV